MASISSNEDVAAFSSSIVRIGSCKNLSSKNFIVDNELILRYSLHCCLLREYRLTVQRYYMLARVPMLPYISKHAQNSINGIFYSIRVDMPESNVGNEILLRER